MWEAIWLSLKLAAVTTFVLLLLGTPLAWWLARSHSLFKEVINTLVALPLVLPPTVLGFYLLLMMGPHSPIGQLLIEQFDIRLAFSFEGLVVGSVIYSMPFVIQPIRNAFASIGERPLEVAATLRHSPLQTFFKVAVPMARPGILSGAILGFAHTLGEFGVVLMIGGNIPGETKVIAVAIYDYVEALEWQQAHQLAAGLLLFSFICILSMNLLEKRMQRRSIC